MDIQEIRMMSLETAASLFEGIMPDQVIEYADRFEQYLLYGTGKKRDAQVVDSVLKIVPFSTTRREQDKPAAQASAEQGEATSGDRVTIASLNTVQGEDEYLTRMLQELHALNDKRQKLIIFMDGPGFPSMNRQAGELLVAQFKVMEEYARILSQRINLAKTA